MGRLLRTLALVVGLALATSACDWTSFRYGPARTGYNDTESAIGLANVGTLTERWTGPTGFTIRSSPAIAGGLAFVGSDDGRIHAFSANGNTGCSGTPKVCTDRWTTTFLAGPLYSSPAVAGGLLYVGSGAFSSLSVFDATGTTGCSGTPKVCAPLWTGATTFAATGSPLVAGGVVYINGAGGQIYAFDAAGTSGCSGTPKVCEPLWTAPYGGVTDSLAVADGVLYSATKAGLYALDAAGSVGCSGTPKVCEPLWYGPGPSTDSGSPAVADGVVYVGSGGAGTDPRGLYAFDATGTTGCSGTPKVCAPLWIAPTVHAMESSPAVAYGIVYIGSSDYNVYAFDATGTSGCSGTPKTCTPLWTAPTGSGVFPSPAVANGVLYVGSTDGKLYGFDAAGTSGCSGTPKVCTPLWSTSAASVGLASPAVANGLVYAGGSDGSLHAFGL